jgi:hypothetical protein
VPADLVRGAGLVLQPGADDTLAVQQGASKRSGVSSRAPARCALRTSTSSSRLARQHRHRARHVHVAAARPDAAHVRHGPGQRGHLVVHAQPAQRGVGVGDQPVAADLVTREACWSASSTATPRAASAVAQALPAGPAPTTSTSHDDGKSGVAGVGMGGAL